MSVFVDTSAFLAVLDADDTEHHRAKRTWEHLITHDDACLGGGGDFSFAVVPITDTPVSGLRG